MNYLLTGPEEYLKHEFLEKLKNSVLGDRESRLDFEVFHAGESEISRILDSFNTLPFISKHRITVIRDVDRFSPREKDVILKYLKSPLSSTTLVLETSSRSPDKFLTQASKLTKPVRCKRLKEGELNTWIKKEFAARKKRISATSVNLIREAAGSDLALLKNEIEKIVTFIGEKDEVTERHVEMILGEAPYRTAFELVDMVLEKRMDRVLASMDRFLAKEKPHQILNLLGWQFRNFIKIKGLAGGSRAKGVSVERASEELGISWGLARRALLQEKRFSRPDLEKNLEIILEGDLFIKRGKLQPRHALERTLVKLCGQAVRVG